MSPYTITTFLAVAALSLSCGCARQNVSLSSSSPDGRLRVDVVEQDHWLDRNFQLRLRRVAEKSSRTIFESPDEGRPIGTERIIWSRDSSRFVLVGRHFFVPETAKLTNGEAIYLLFDVASGKLRCNSQQQTNYPSFTREDMKGTNWNAGI